MDNSVQMPVRVLWKDIGGYCHGNKLWFVHRDRLAEHRYSDGARLCVVVPRLGNRQPGRLRMLRRLEIGPTFIAMHISFCGIPLTLLVYLVWGTFFHRKPVPNKSSMIIE